MSLLRNRLRHLAQRAIRVGLRLRAQPLVLGAGPLLVVSPHPDDDVFGCGGLLAAARRAGRTVHLIVLTDGAASHPGHPAVPAPELARRRADEARASAAILGIDAEAVEFLGLPDGRLPVLGPAERERAVAALAAQIGRLQPAALLLPNRHDGSTEHAAAHALVLEAVARAPAGVRRLGTLVWSAHSPRRLAAHLTAPEPLYRLAFPDDAPVKAAAIEAHGTQVRPLAPWPRAVLPDGFVASFDFPEEFFLDESEPQPARGWRLREKLRYLLRGRREGLGRPVPVATLDREYTSGAWDHFHGADEAPRYAMLRAFLAEGRNRPRVLDLGCGSGRLAAVLTPDDVADYLGVDLSPEALRRARRLGRPAPLDRFAIGDMETWRPAPGQFDVIVCTESLDYTSDPLATAREVAGRLAPGGVLVVSRHCSGNHDAFWRRLDRGFATDRRERVTGPSGQQWEVRRLRPRAASPALKIVTVAPASAVSAPPCAES